MLIIVLLCLIRKPFSDQIISSMSGNRKINISRRTVTKYREEMEIKASSVRRRL